MATLLRDHAAAKGDLPALIDEGGATSWAELDRRELERLDRDRVPGS